MSARPQPSVLVVEDEAELRQTIAESLTEQGFVVAQSADGADALDRLKGFAYDAIVIDLRLPDADGLEVLDAAVGRYPDILPIMVTGFGGVAEAVSAMRRGAIDFLIKPFRLGELLERIEPADAWHHDVEQEEIGEILGLVEELQHRLTARRGRDLIAAGGEGPVQPLEQDGVVFGDVDRRTRRGGSRHGRHSFEGWNEGYFEYRGRRREGIRPPGPTDCDSSDCGKINAIRAPGTHAIDQTFPR